MHYVGLPKPDLLQKPKVGRKPIVLDEQSDTQLNAQSFSACIDEKLLFTSPLCLLKLVAHRASPRPAEKLPHTADFTTIRTSDCPDRLRMLHEHRWVCAMPRKLVSLLKHGFLNRLGSHLGRTSLKALALPSKAYFTLPSIRIASKSDLRMRR
jgi:hypothetical protein